jgi:hypothetical protein
MEAAIPKNANPAAIQNPNLISLTADDATIPPYALYVLHDVFWLVCLDEGLRGNPIERML